MLTSHQSSVNQLPLNSPYETGSLMLACSLHLLSPLSRHMSEGFRPSTPHSVTLFRNLLFCQMDF